MEEYIIEVAQASVRRLGDQVELCTLKDAEEVESLCDLWSKGGYVKAQRMAGQWHMWEIMC